MSVEMLTVYMPSVCCALYFDDDAINDKLLSGRSSL